MPDGQVLTIGSEMYEAPELLFNPTLAGGESLGASALAYASLSKTDIDNRAELLNNVVLTGGSTMFDGFAARMESDLKVQSNAHAGVLKAVCCFLMLLLLLLF